jgi:hypothetical protein
MDTRDRLESRRQLLKWLSTSPLLAFPGIAALAAEDASPAPLALQDPRVWAPPSLQDLITNPEDAINVFDFEPVMRKNVPPAHFGYMASGIDDEVTLRANREGFLKFQLRPRRLVDVSTVDMSTEILGVKYDTPIIIAPIGSHRAYHADGETAVARAAKVGNHLMILSTQSTTSPEDRDGGARRADLVSALRHQQVGRLESLPHARGACGLSRRRRDGRSQWRPQPGNAVPAAANGYA